MRPASRKYSFISPIVYFIYLICSTTSYLAVKSNEKLPSFAAKVLEKIPPTFGSSQTAFGQCQSSDANDQFTMCSGFQRASQIVSRGAFMIVETVSF
jgi:hypothetical protein